MAFIVKKVINGRDYYYLRESIREGDRVISRDIAYLGKNKKEAEIKMKEILHRDEKEKTGDSELLKTKKEFHKNIKFENSVSDKISIEELANFCKRKGFVFRSSDIYGGFSGFWDYGHLGVELFNNIKKLWWDYFVMQKDNIIGMESSIVSHPKVWKASGHISNFSDVSVKCMKCKKFNKVDKFELDKAKCSFCGGELDKGSAKDLNLMFKTQVGPVEEDSLLSYLRPETAQGMFINFKLIQQTSRMQLPFGIAQIGRCFRNEIAPRDFLFRSREFHIAEFEFFINPYENKCELLDDKHLNLRFNLLDAETQKQEKSGLKEVSIGEILKEGKLDEWHAYWLAEQILWFKKLGLEKDIKIREHMKNELSHYSSATFDLDYEYPFGSKEIAGIANRGQYDLTQHQNESKESFEIFDDKIGKKVIPRVIEPTFGIERIFLAILTKAYHYDKERENVVLKIPAFLAPVKAGIFPIVKNKEFIGIAYKVKEILKKDFKVIYDDGGTIGRRYARQDEIGTPFCITIDGDSIKNKDVTIRERDTTRQIRVKISSLKETFEKLIRNEIDFEDAGAILKA
ncbi:MAG: glycine--tRNA ligase [Nanoarchaeota archaeon]